MVAKISESINIFNIGLLFFTSIMKIAIVYDYLNQLGGGERVLGALCRMFPGAPIYTILYDREKTEGRFEGKKIYTSFLDFNFARNHHRLFIPLMPLGVKSLDLKEEYDLVISVGAGYAKGVKYARGVKHIYYCFTPLRYAWNEEYINDKFGNMFSKALKPLAKPLLHYLRQWDLRTAQKPDKILTLSRFMGDKIKTCYGRDSEILYPSFDQNFFFYDPKIKKSDYFLAGGRLMYYKRFDLVIEVFNELGWPLKIAGDGPDYAALKRIVKSPKIEMLGFVSDQELRRLYQEAQALIFPQIEDFGLVAVEAQACGVPVIAFKAGGTLDIIEDGKNGLFFEKQTLEGLIEALQRFKATVFDYEYTARSAKRFSYDVFQNNLRDYIGRCLQEKRT